MSDIFIGASSGANKFLTYSQLFTLIPEEKDECVTRLVKGGFRLVSLAALPVFLWLGQIFNGVSCVTKGAFGLAATVLDSKICGFTAEEYFHEAKQHFFSCVVDSLLLLSNLFKVVFILGYIFAPTMTLSFNDKIQNKIGIDSPKPQSSKVAPTEPAVQVAAVQQ